MEDPQEDPLAVHCLCVCSGSALFCGAGRAKKRGEQLKWSLTFSLYVGSFLCAQLPGPVRTARLGRVCFLYLA